MRMSLSTTTALLSRPHVAEFQGGWSVIWNEQPDEAGRWKYLHILYVFRLTSVSALSTFNVAARRAPEFHFLLLGPEVPLCG